MFMDRYVHKIHFDNLTLKDAKNYDIILKDANIDFISERILADSTTSSEKIIQGNHERKTIFSFLTKDDMVQAKLLGLV